MEVSIGDQTRDGATARDLVTGASQQVVKERVWPMGAEHDEIRCAELGMLVNDRRGLPDGDAYAVDILPFDEAYSLELLLYLTACLFFYPCLTILIQRGGEVRKGRGHEAVHDFESSLRAFCKLVGRAQPEVRVMAQIGSEKYGVQGHLQPHQEILGSLLLEHKHP